MDIDEGISTFFAKSQLPVLFAGSGVSSRAGMPGWIGYLRSLAAAVAEYDEFTKFQMDKSVNAGALGDAATYYKLCREMPESTKLRELVLPFEVFDSEKLSGLVKLPFKAVATTNYDRALFSAYAKFAGLAANEVNIDDPTLDSAAFSNALYIARIHGRVEVPTSIRLTAPELSELQHNASYQKYLEHLFTRRQVLFVGFSFFDPALEAVIRSIRQSSKSMHGQEHWALVPSNASAQFVSELEAHSIRRICYSDADNHRELWDGIERALAKLKLIGRKLADVRDIPFSVAKKYLATAFARSRIGKQREPLAQVIAEGIVSGVIQNSGPQGVSEDSLIEQLRADLSLSKDESRTLVYQSLTSLAREGMCKPEVSDSITRYVSKYDGSLAYSNAIARLAQGAIDRYLLTERGSDSAQLRTFVESLFANLLLQRGWELGAAFAARRMPEDVDVSGLIDGMDSLGLKPAVLNKLSRSITSLLLRPDDEEAELLAELGRTAFGLELLLEAPHDSVFLKRTLPEIIYVDANVIMPAITPCHPHYDLFNSTISALKESADSAVLDISLRVYDGYLNEIVSHKQLARDAMRASNGDGAMWEERSVGLYGSGNVNVFIGAYFNYKGTHADASFDQFLHFAAPYNSESDLRCYIEKRGFQVVRDGQAQKKNASEILHALEKYYSAKLETKKKSAIAIRHDATQLAIVNADLEDRRRSIFVSADRGIRFALEYEGFSSVSNSMITHLGLAQLVELLVGRLPASRGLSSLLWLSPVSSDTFRIRNYLISLALSEHDAALAMNMSEIVDTIAEDAGMELERKNLVLNPDIQASRVEVNRTLERYEKEFFRRMNIEAERIRERR